jgi:F-type H+-transporting ATPase subunit a
MTEEAAHRPELGEFINHGLSFQTIFTIKAGPISIPITETVIVTWAVMAVLVVLSLILTRRLAMFPGKVQVLLEAFVDLINRTAKEHLGKAWRVFAPYFTTVALFIFTSSIIGIFSPVLVGAAEPAFIVKPPTRDVNVTGALASITIGLVIVGGIVYRGPRGWLKSFIHPMPAMLPFTLLEYVIKPVTLALRLFGNIVGAYIIMLLLEYAIPVAVLPVASLYFDFIDSAIQTLVFTLLSFIYLGEAVNPQHDAESASRPKKKEN